MKLTEQQQQWLVFGLGMLFSFRSIPKAYAPTVNIPTPPQSPKDICEKGEIRGIWREYTQAPSFKNDGGWCDYGRPVLYNEAQCKQSGGKWEYNPSSIHAHGLPGNPPPTHHCINTLNPLTAITPQSKSCPQGQTYTKRIYWNGGSFEGCATPEQIKNYNIMSLIS